MLQERYADSSPAKLDTTAKAKDSVGLGETSNNDERIESSKSAKGEEIIQIGIKGIFIKNSGSLVNLQNFNAIVRWKDVIKIGDHNVSQTKRWIKPLFYIIL